MAFFDPYGPHSQDPYNQPAAPPPPPPPGFNWYTSPPGSHPVSPFCHPSQGFSPMTTPPPDAGILSLNGSTFTHPQAFEERSDSLEFFSSSDSQSSPEFAVQRRQSFNMAPPSAAMERNETQFPAAEVSVDDEAVDDNFAEIRYGSLYGNTYDLQDEELMETGSGEGDGPLAPREPVIPVPSERYRHNPYGRGIFSAETFSSSEYDSSSDFEFGFGFASLGATTTNESATTRRHSPYAYSVQQPTLLAVSSLIYPAPVQPYNPFSESPSDPVVSFYDVRVSLPRPMETDYKGWFAAVFRAQYFLWSHNAKISLLAIRLCSMVEEAAPDLYRYMNPQGNSQLYRELPSFGMYVWFYSLDDCRDSLLRTPHDLRVSIYPYEVSFVADKAFDVIYEEKLIRLTQLRVEDFCKNKFLRKAAAAAAAAPSGPEEDKRTLLPITALSRITAVPSEDREFWHLLPNGPPKRFVCFHFTHEAALARALEENSKKPHGQSSSLLITLLPQRHGGKRVRFSAEFRPRMDEASIRVSIDAFKEKLLHSLDGIEGEHSIGTTRQLNGVDRGFTQLAQSKCSRLRDRKKLRRQLGYQARFSAGGDGSAKPTSTEQSSESQSESTTPPPTPAHRVTGGGAPTSSKSKPRN
jgi:hypothetical protein